MDHMKLGFFFTEVFWGSLLVLLGISMIIKTIFGIDIPVVRTILAILLIYTGISIIANIGSKHKQKQSIVFSEQVIIPENINNYYSVMFGKSTIDLTHIQTIDELLQIKIDVAFGQALVKISRSIPTEIASTVTFGNAFFPDNTSISSGKYTYKNYAGQTKPLVKVRSHIAFGNMQVIAID